MSKNTIATLAFAVTTLAGSAFAGSAPVTVASTPCTPACKPAAASKLTGSLQAGYQTNYTYRGLVASRSVLGGDGVIPAALDLRYAVDPSMAILGNVSYDTVISGHKVYGLEGFNFENEANLTVALEKKLCKYVKGLKVSGGYNLTHGGLEGVFAKFMEDKAHSVTQELFVNAEQAIGKHFYAGLTINYSFQGMTGWWYQPYVGYKAALCPCSDIDITAGWTATSSYFSANKYSDLGVISNANGSQAWFVKAAIDAKVMKNVSIVPFVSFNWAGNGALKANRGHDMKPYKNFGVVAGAQVVYKF